MSRRTVPACFASWSKQLDSETRRNRLTHQNSFLARSKSITIVKWISHEWRIILQSSFLCHPLNGHGIDHEAISMRKCNSERDSCQLLCRFTPVVFTSTVRMMAIIKINLAETPEWELLIGDVRAAAHWSLDSISSRRRQSRLTRPRSNCTWTARDVKSP